MSRALCEDSVYKDNTRTSVGRRGAEESSLQLSNSAILVLVSTHRPAQTPHKVLVPSVRTLRTQGRLLKTSQRAKAFRRSDLSFT